MKNSVITYRPDIDGIRGLAILFVVGFHAAPYYFPGGYVGVDIFFVVSGYIISAIILELLQKDEFSIIDFYAHRIRRIFPALLLVLASCLIFGWFALFSSEYEQLGKHVFTGAIFVSNLTYWREAGYFDINSELKPLLHLWSLGIEEQFYIFWPLILSLAWKRINNLFLLITLLGFFAFTLNVLLVKGHAVATFYLPITRAWELLIGCGLAYIQLFKLQEAKEFLKCWMHRSLFPNAQWFLVANISAALGMVLISLSVTKLNRYMEFPGWWALLPTAGAALIIAAGPNAFFNRFVLSNRTMVFIGIISYPLYLWHWPLLSFSRIVEEGDSTALIKAAAVALAFVLAFATYLLIERPIRRRSAHSLAFILCALMTIMAASGYYIAISGGFTSRFVEFEKKLSSVKWILERDESCSEAVPIISRYCRISNSNLPPTVAIVGDSHGNRLFYGLSTWFEKRNENLLQLGEGGCLPFWDVEGGEFGAEDTCKSKINGQLEYIVKTSSIKTVILSSRGPLYISGKGFGEVEKNTRTFLRHASRTDQLSYSDVYSLAFRDTLKRLHAANKKVVFVIDNPQLGFDPMSCVSLRPLQFSKHVREPCGISRIEVDDINREYRTILASIAMTFPDVRFLDTQKILCDEKYCWAMKDGELLYMDGDHLSKFGAEYIVNHMSEDIFK